MMTWRNPMESTSSVPETVSSAPQMAAHIATTGKQVAQALTKTPSVQVSLEGNPMDPAHQQLVLAQAGMGIWVW